MKLLTGWLPVALLSTRRADRQVAADLADQH
jgi:hypothetical protein